MSEDYYNRISLWPLSLEFLNCFNGKSGAVFSDGRVCYKFLAKDNPKECMVSVVKRNVNPGSLFDSF